MLYEICWVEKFIGFKAEAHHNPRLEKEANCFFLWQEEL